MALARRDAAVRAVLGVGTFFPPVPAMAAAIPELPERSLPRAQRSAGTARIAFKRRGEKTVIDDLFQSGCMKARFPRSFGDAAEAVLINTSGGLTGGDQIGSEVTWGEGTVASVTSQAAERVYKASADVANVETRLTVADDALGLWLPQETIFFDGGAIRRTTQADVAEGGRLLATESLVFGRRAMGEVVEIGLVSDGWRIRFAGKLVFADRFAIDGPIGATLRRPAIAGGARSIATLLYVGADAEARLATWRELTAGLSSNAACSRIGPVLVTRIVGDTGDQLRRDLQFLLTEVLASFADSGAGGLGLPRVWAC
ncbi:urease accessory protein UreD [Rhodobium gokarnense]|uniref:Urease accessory protein UreD n=1 Tax=Rhodobium gokarnense TaxID=364296 RepID=A0ABT3H962_9HYPH|nr:urease accessory protein UreD [Rhodobium gokarnense]MCW2306945.1 urease accessory protein [Rhodobium gokarnense]